MRQLVLTVVLCVASGLALAQEPTAATAEVDKSQWAPWDHNSIQPPPATEVIELPPTTVQAGDGPTEEVYRSAVGWFDEALKHVDELTGPAEVAAEHVLAGGRIYAGGSPGFVQEMIGRAGGFTFLRDWKGERLGEHDVLLLGQFTPRDELTLNASVPGLAYQGGWNLCKGQVVRVSSHNWVEIQRTLPMMRRDSWNGRLADLDTRVPDGGAWSDVSLGQMATTAWAWAFQGEVFAAATRKGKTLATFASLAEPGGDEWYKTFQNDTVHPKFSADAIPAGEVSRTYLRTCQKQLGRFLLEGETKQMRLAGERLAATMKDGKAAWVVVSGHIHIKGSLIPHQFPRIVMLGRTWQWRPDLLVKGDTFFWLGYLSYPQKEVDQALASEANVLTMTVADGPTDERRTHVRGFWEPWDSCVNVAGYPVRILPTSGVVQTVQWYSLMAETERAATGNLDQPVAAEP